MKRKGKRKPNLRTKWNEMQDKTPPPWNMHRILHGHRLKASRDVITLLTWQQWWRHGCTVPSISRHKMWHFHITRKTKKYNKKTGGSFILIYWRFSIYGDILFFLCISFLLFRRSSYAFECNKTNFYLFIYFCAKS